MRAFAERGSLDAVALGNSAHALLEVTHDLYVNGIVAVAKDGLATSTHDHYVARLGKALHQRRQHSEEASVGRTHLRARHPVTVGAKRKRFERVGVDVIDRREWGEVHELGEELRHTTALRVGALVVGLGLWLGPAERARRLRQQPPIREQVAEFLGDTGRDAADCTQVAGDGDDGHGRTPYLPH